MPDFAEMLQASSNQATEAAKEENLRELHRDFFISPLDRKDEYEEEETTDEKPTFSKLLSR